MKARLTDGRIVDLDADYCQCGCGTTFVKGPCWIRMDKYDKAENHKLLDMAKDQEQSAKTYSDMAMVSVYLHRFAELEIVRLDYKKYNMQRYGIVELIEDEQNQTSPA